MPQIIIENLFSKVVKVEDTPISVLKNIQNSHVDWMHACGGKGRCTTCKMNIIKGIENLSPPSPFEKRCITAGLLNSDERLACQCVPKGDLLVRVPEECKLPHMEYSK